MSSYRHVGHARVHRDGSARRQTRPLASWRSGLAALDAANGTLNYDAGSTAAGGTTARQFGGIKSAAKRRLGPEYPLVEHVNAEVRWWVKPHSAPSQRPPGARPGGNIIETGTQPHRLAHTLAHPTN